MNAISSAFMHFGNMRKNTYDYVDGTRPSVSDTDDNYIDNCAIRSPGATSIPSNITRCGNNMHGIQIR